MRDFVCTRMLLKYIPILIKEEVISNEWVLRNYRARMAAIV